MSSPTGRGADDALRALAVARGIAITYTDADSRLASVSEPALVGVLKALGEPIERAADAPECLRILEARAATTSWPPVVVAWDGKLHLQAGHSVSPERREPPTPVAPGPQKRAAAAARTAPTVSKATGLVLELEDGSVGSELLTEGADGSVSSRRALPFGLHRLRREMQPRSEPVLVISAPLRARTFESRSWGVFAPTYALSDGRNSPAGDLTCLEQLGRLAGGLGASYVATLPLLADYSRIEAPGASTSPYSPLSRSWWNEAYLDPRRLPELASEFSAGPKGVERPVAPVARHADVGAAAAFVRPLLGIGAERVIAGGGRRLASFRQFQADRPDVLRYATFRAAAEAAGPDRSRWPVSWANGDLLAGRDVPHLAVLAHVYAQWATDEQLGVVAAATAETGCRLMLDLPIGCRPDGYDPWAFPGSFAAGATVGAPPDKFFSGGQDWGFRPLDPEGDRRSGYPVADGGLAHMLRHCGALRIDHVMGVQRLWWIPSGASPTDGAYVSYHSDELLALACLEAWRRDAVLIGEDLGTVDPALKESLQSHRIAGMHVAVFDLEAMPGRRLSPRPASVAYVDTHDTATFAGFFDGTDIDDRSRLGLVTAAQADAERVARDMARKLVLERLVASGQLAEPDVDDAKAVHAAVLEELGTSAAGLVVVTLEDLWAEHDPQNIPGTTTEHQNFSRRFPLEIGEIAADDRLLEPLVRLDGARRATHDPAHGAAAGGGW